MMAEGWGGILKWGFRPSVNAVLDVKNLIVELVR